MRESTRWANGKTSVHWRRFITSPPDRADRILSAARERWRVENCFHRTLCAPFGADGSMVRVEHAAENMSTLRRLALNLVKGEKSLKIGGRRSGRGRAGIWSICERYSESRIKMRLPFRARHKRLTRPPRYLYNHFSRLLILRFNKRKPDGRARLARPRSACERAAIAETARYHPKRSESR